MTERFRANQRLMAEAFLLSSPIGNEVLEDSLKRISKKAEEFYDVNSKDFDYYSEKATKYLEDIVSFRQIANIHKRAPRGWENEIMRLSIVYLCNLIHIYDEHEHAE